MKGCVFIVVLRKFLRERAGSLLSGSSWTGVDHCNGEILLSCAIENDAYQIMLSRLLLYKAHWLIFKIIIKERLEIVEIKYHYS